MAKKITPPKKEKVKKAQVLKNSKEGRKQLKKYVKMAEQIGLDKKKGFVLIVELNESGSPVQGVDFACGMSHTGYLEIITKLVARSLDESTRKLLEI